MGVGESILIRAIATATGRSAEKIKRELAEKGDLGMVAQESRGGQRMMIPPRPLTVFAVFSTLREIALLSGSAAVNRKIEKIVAMMTACRGSEARYIVRMLAGNLRIGLAGQTVLVALGRAVALTPPTGQPAPPRSSDEALTEAIEHAVMLIKTAYWCTMRIAAPRVVRSTDGREWWGRASYRLSELPDLGRILHIILTDGLEMLPLKCTLTPGIPLRPMLAYPSSGLDDVFGRFEGMEFTCEFKYDGERAQVHMLDDGSISVFSRNSENLTAKYPDLVSRMSHVAKPAVRTYIIDCESVAWDREAKCILPFQMLSTRRRKETSADLVRIQVCLFAFDLLYLNGKSYIREPLKVRRRVLYDSFVEAPGEFQFATKLDTHDVDAMADFLDEAIASMRWCAWAQRSSGR